MKHQDFWLALESKKFKMWFLFTFQLFFNNSSRKAVSLLKPCSANFYQRGIIEFKNTAFRKASHAPLIRLLEIVGESGAFRCGLCMPAFSRLATSPPARVPPNLLRKTRDCSKSSVWLKHPGTSNFTCFSFVRWPRLGSEQDQDKAG